MLSKNQKKTGIAIIVGMIIVVFIFWGTGNYRAVGGNILAKVNGTSITRSAYNKELLRRIESMERQTKQSVSSETLQNLRIYDQVLNQMIDEILLQQEANRLGIRVSKSELQQTIAGSPYFQDSQGRFSIVLYKRRLAYMRMTPPEYEGEVKTQLLIRKLGEFLANSIFVSDAEVKKEFLLADEKVNLDVVKIDAADLVDKLPIQKEEIDVYVKENEVAIRGYYDTHLADYNKPEKVKARHILIEVPREGATLAQEEEAKKKLENIRKKATPKNFASLAKKHSEGPSGKEGGALGWFDRDSMVKEFSDIAFSIKPGTISNVFKSPFGFHIVLVEDKQSAIEQLLETVEVEIAEKLIKEDRAQEKAKELSIQVLEAWKNNKPITSLLSPYKITPTSTGLFSRTTEFIPKIGRSTDVIEAAFELSKDNPFPRDPKFVSNSWVIFKLKNKISANYSQFAKRKAVLTKQINTEKSTDAIRQFYADMRNRAKVIRTKAKLDQRQ
ncbi:SurA N-terminal domain-containing protein [Bdellovibrionota bacterium]